MAINLILIYLYISLFNPPVVHQYHYVEKATLKGTSATLKEQIIALVAEPEMQHATFSFCALSVKNDSAVACYNSTQSLAPASNLKLVTTAAALEVLGENFRFETTLEYDGSMDGTGTLNGNLYIRGGGDPTLGTGNLKALVKSWVAAVDSLGVKRITGAVIGDASVFDDRPMPDKWLWEDMGNYYGAGASGLSIHDNLYFLTLKQGANTADPTRVLRTEPYMEDIQFINEVTAGKKGTADNCYIYGAPYTSLRYLRGTLPPGKGEFVVRGSIPDPALFATRLLTGALKEAGIAVDQAPSTDRILASQGTFLKKDNRVAFHRTLSAPLREIVRTTNVKSVNLYAEHLLKMIGYKKSGTGSTEEGIKAIQALWAEKGIPAEGFFMEDGSGLSRYNALTTEQMATMLKVYHRSPVYQALYESMPVAGVSGSLATLCKGTPAENNLRAKSGLLTRVRGYSGYVTTKSGEVIAFSMLANNYSGNFISMSRRFEKLMIAMAEEE